MESIQIEWVLDHHSKLNLGGLHYFRILISWNNAAEQRGPPSCIIKNASDTPISISKNWIFLTTTAPVLSLVKREGKYFSDGNVILLGPQSGGQGRKHSQFVVPTGLKLPVSHFPIFWQEFGSETRNEWERGVSWPFHFLQILYHSLGCALTQRKFNMDKTWRVVNKEGESTTLTPRNTDYSEKVCLFTRELSNVQNFITYVSFIRGDFRHT